MDLSYYFIVNFLLCVPDKHFWKWSVSDEVMKFGSLYVFCFTLSVFKSLICEWMQFIQIVELHFSCFIVFWIRSLCVMCLCCRAALYNKVDIMRFLYEEVRMYWLDTFFMYLYLYDAIFTDLTKMLLGYCQLIPTCLVIVKALNFGVCCIKSLRSQTEWLLVVVVVVVVVVCCCCCCALMSCVGLTLLSFHDVCKLSKYFSLWKLEPPHSPSFYPSSHNHISQTIPSDDVTQEIKLPLMDSFYHCLRYPYFS